MLAVGCLLLAGCASPMLDATPPAGRSAPPKAEPAGDLAANDCTSLVARAYYPTGTGPGVRPEGWNRSQGPATELEMTIYQCKRIAFAGWERPVALMFEAHGDVDAPEPCKQGPWNIYRVLHAVWTNDTAVAEALTRLWNVSVRVADFQRDPATALEAWTWDQGRLEIPSLTAGEAETGTRLRFAWQSGVGVNLLDLQERSVAPQYQAPLVVGQVAPPLLAAERSGRFVGEGGLSVRSTLEAKLSKFGDALCESPLPS
jgi:hypothetical protein